MVLTGLKWDGDDFIDYYGVIINKTASPITALSRDGVAVWQGVKPLRGPLGESLGRVPPAQGPKAFDTPVSKGTLGPSAVGEAVWLQNNG